MSDYIIVGVSFTVAAIILTITTALISLGGVQGVRDNFKRVEGKGILAGIARVVVVVFLIVFAFVFGASQTQALEHSYFNYLEVEAGIVYTKNPSPQCTPDSRDNRGTSDLRLTFNTFSLISNDGRLRFDTNIEYLHHSGAFCQDDRSFDSLGPKMRLRWEF